MESGANVILKKNNLFISEECSKRISSLRFILACLVVMFHNNKTLLFILNPANLTFSNPEFVAHLPQYIFSYLFTLAPVPLFFMFSAYLQYKKNDDYLVLLKKRIKTIFLPLVLWPAIIIFGKILIKLACIAIFPDKVSHEIPFVSEWSVRDWFCAFFGYYFPCYEKMTLCEPFILPFYFIRDLFILIIISPLIKKLVQKAPYAYGLFVAAIYFFNIRPAIVCTNALVFYSLGFYFAEYNFDFFKFADRITWKQLAVVVIPVMYFVMKNNKSEIIILISCLIMLKFSKLFVEKSEKFFATLKYFDGLSFFLYAIHLPYLLMFFTSKWYSKIPVSPVTDFFEYFGISIIVCVTGTIIGIILRKICPKVFGLINGGR